MGKYKFGKAERVVRTDNGYKIVVYCTNGKYTPMVTFDDETGAYKEVIFDTIEEAMKEVERFNEFSWTEV